MRFSGFKWMVIFCQLILLIGCNDDYVSAYHEHGYQYYPPPESKGGWRKNTDPRFLHALGFDSKKLFGLARWSLGLVPPNRYDAILIIKDGWIISEWYDEPEGQFTPVNTASIGKSFAAILMGLVLEEARLKFDNEINENSLLYDRRWLNQGFPLSDSRKNNITIENVLTHTAGFVPEQDRKGNQLERGRWLGEDHADWVLGHDPQWPETQVLYYPPSQPEQYSENEQWGDHKGAYSSVGFAHFGILIENLVDQKPAVYLNEKIIDPLGMESVEVFRFEHIENAVDYELKYREIESDWWFTGGGIRISIRDLARFAYLLLNNGLWGHVDLQKNMVQRQVVEKEWVEKFLTSYEYQNIRTNWDDYFGSQYPKDMFRMSGYGGSIVFAVPSMDLIAIRLGRSAFDQAEIERTFLEKLFDSIL